MYLEGIIVCVNYSDFLAHTLPHNKNHFDNLIVITDTKDEKTKKLCEYYHVRCIQTDIFYENGDSFNKGAAINYGLSQLENKGWVIHLDADIYLPPLTRNILENIPLEPHKIYGADRLMCPSYEKWMEFINDPQKIQEGWVYIHMNIFPIGVRIAEYNNKDAGYEPIGYFQLWNPKGSDVFNYPTQHDYCDRTDVLFCKKFARKDRELLPEIIVIHLESEGLSVDAMGKNWKGRKTKLFQPDSNRKDNMKLEIEELKKSTKEIVDKYNLSHLFVGASSKKLSLRRKIWNKLMRIAFRTKRSTYRCR
jgi:hypothetical protein